MPSILFVTEKIMKRAENTFMRIPNGGITNIRIPKNKGYGISLIPLYYKGEPARKCLDVLRTTIYNGDSI